MDPTFYGTFTNRIDAKGRVSVPAPFRALLEGQKLHGCIVSPSVVYPMLEGSGVGRTDWMREQLETLPEFSDDYFAVQQMFADTVQVPFDSEGRIILPQSLLDHAGLSSNIVFAGSGNVFQMWEPEGFEAHKERMRQRRREHPAVFQPRRPSPRTTP